MSTFAALNPILQALLATLFTWGMTAAGAATVFLAKNVSRSLLNAMLGFAAGVMIAASFWSLLAPAIAMSEGSGVPGWIPATAGFLLGGAFLWVVDRILPHLHLGLEIEQAEGIKTTWQRSVLLVTAITLHNFPEGLAVGVAFGAVAAGLPAATLAGAIALTIGIGIQNFPEGLAVSMPGDGSRTDRRGGATPAHHALSAAGGRVLRAQLRLDVWLAHVQPVVWRLHPGLSRAARRVRARQDHGAGPIVGRDRLHSPDGCRSDLASGAAGCYRCRGHYPSAAPEDFAKGFIVTESRTDFSNRHLWVILCCPHKSSP